MMTLSALNQFLKQHTTEETQRLNGVKKDYSQFPVARGKFDTPCYRFDTNLEDLRSLFLSKKVLPSYYNFAVVKQDRFENVPLHIHEWLELSYIYSGSCTMTINKTTFRLKAGQMVLIRIKFFSFEHIIKVLIPKVMKTSIGFLMVLVLL